MQPGSAYEQAVVTAVRRFYRASNGYGDCTPEDLLKIVRDDIDSCLATRRRNDERRNFQRLKGVS